jgi:hypothetical protein
VKRRITPYGVAVGSGVSSVVGVLLFFGSAERVGVAVRVGVGVGVRVGVAVRVGMGVAVRVGVNNGVGVACTSGAEDCCIVVRTLPTIASANSTTTSCVASLNFLNGEGPSPPVGAG